MPRHRSSCSGGSRSPAAAAGPQAVLSALAAVDVQGAVAMAMVASPQADRGYHATVKLVAAKAPTVQAGGTLSADAASAVNAALSAQAKAWALVVACATARNKAHGALKAGKAGDAKRQTRAAGGFAKKAAAAVDRARTSGIAAAAALRASGVAEVNVSSADAGAFSAKLKSQGLPADLEAALRTLGLTAAQRKRALKILVDRPAVRRCGADRSARR